jgi:CRISPR/Cas system CSM-associated protein Csm2 small subunit
MVQLNQPVPKPGKKSSESENSQELTGWQPYHLDHYAQELVLKHREQKNVLNETHKMRITVAYGLERFWGEHLRLKREDKNKSAYWKDVWDKLAEILKKAGVTLPNDEVNDNTEKIQDMANKIWSIDMNNQRIALMVLTQFCDSLVWWNQRYKKGKDSQS